MRVLSPNAQTKLKLQPTRPRGGSTNTSRLSSSRCPDDQSDMYTTRQMSQFIYRDYVQKRQFIYRDYVQKRQFIYRDYVHVALNDHVRALTLDLQIQSKLHDRHKVSIYNLPNERRKTHTFIQVSAGVHCRC